MNEKGVKTRPLPETDKKRKRTVKEVKDSAREESGWEVWHSVNVRSVLPQQPLDRVPNWPNGFVKVAIVVGGTPDDAFDLTNSGACGPWTKRRFTGSEEPYAMPTPLAKNLGARSTSVGDILVKYERQRSRVSVAERVGGPIGTLVKYERPAVGSIRRTQVLKVQGCGFAKLPDWKTSGPNATAPTYFY